MCGNLCDKFRTTFLIKEQGVHSGRIFGYATFDILGISILGLLTSPFFFGNIFASTFLWFLVGQVFHIIFRINTTFLNKNLDLEF